MSAEARAVAFSPDGTLLAAAGSDAIQIWRTSNWTPVWTCTTETVGINSLSFSPNGTFLTFGRDDGTVCQMWNPAAAPVQLWLGATQEGRFTIANPSYSPFLSVQTSSNLSQWSLLTNLVAATNAVQFADPSPPPKERFYRVTTPQ
jgi:WD40 repeat protein